MRKKSVYIVVGKSWYDTSSYSVSSYYYFVSQHRTLEGAERKLERYANDGDQYDVIEVLPHEYDDAISTLKNNRYLI